MPILPADVTMRLNQKFTAAVSFFDISGNPAPVDGPPSWRTDDQTMLMLTPSPDGMTCVVQSTGSTVGATTVHVKGDSDLGQGSVGVTASLGVTVLGGIAVEAEITPGPVTD